MPFLPAPLHISVGAMDEHTRLLFYGLCFGPLVVFALVAYREHRRIRRELEAEEQARRDSRPPPVPDERRRAPRPRRSTLPGPPGGDDADETPERAGPG